MSRFALPKMAAAWMTSRMDRSSNPSVRSAAKSSLVTDSGSRVSLTLTSTTARYRPGRSLSTPSSSRLCIRSRFFDRLENNLEWTDAQ